MDAVQDCLDGSVSALGRRLFPAGIFAGSQPGCDCCVRHDTCWSPSMGDGLDAIQDCLDGSVSALGRRPFSGGIFVGFRFGFDCCIRHGIWWFRIGCIALVPCNQQGPVQNRSYNSRKAGYGSWLSNRMCNSCPQFRRQLRSPIINSRDPVGNECIRYECSPSQGG